MSDHEKMWVQYTNAWSEKNTSKRMESLKTVLDENSVYTDPYGVKIGHQEISDYMAGFQEQVGEGRFEHLHFYFHNDQSIAKWRLLAGNGQEIHEGVSYGLYDQSGKLIKMTGFFPTV